MCRRDEPPISKRRVAGAVIALAAGALAAYFAIDASRRARQFDEWLIAEPTRFTADLSRIGGFEAPFTQSCQIAHGASIVLKVTDAPDDATSLLTGLKGKAEVVGADGKAVVAVDYPDPRLLESWGPGDEIELAYFHPFPTGSYTLRMQVMEPAPALAGHAQVVSARYQLCGLEKMPAVITAGFSIAAGITALIVGGCTAVGLKRHGWRRGGPAGGT